MGRFACNLLQGVRKGVYIAEFVLSALHSAQSTTKPLMKNGVDKQQTPFHNFPWAAEVHLQWKIVTSITELWPDIVLINIGGFIFTTHVTVEIEITGKTGLGRIARISSA